MPPNFICSGFNENGEPITFPCDENQACASAIIQPDPLTSLYSLSYEFELYCDRTYLVGFCGTVLFTGNTFDQYIIVIIIT